MREPINSGRADYSPMFLSEIPFLFRRGVCNDMYSNLYHPYFKLALAGYKPLDIALIQTSPPDVHGFCSLGVSVDCVRAAVQCATHVICQINRHMPRTFGDGLIHLSNFDKVKWQMSLHSSAAVSYLYTPIEMQVVYHNECLPELKPPPSNERIERIGELIAENLVRTGATLQMGIGAIPDAVLRCLKHHKDLGIHSEMFSDGIIVSILLDLSFLHVL